MYRLSLFVRRLASDCIGALSCKEASQSADRVFADLLRYRRGLEHQHEPRSTHMDIPVWRDSILSLVICAQKPASFKE